MIKTKSRIIKIIFIVFLSLMMMTGGIVFLCNETATPPAQMEEKVDEVEGIIADTSKFTVYMHSYGSSNRGIKFQYRVTSGFSGNPQYSSHDSTEGTDVRRYGNITDAKNGTYDYTLYGLAGQTTRRFEFRSNAESLGTNITGGKATINGTAYDINSMGGNYIETNVSKYTSSVSYTVNFYFDIRLPINLNNGTVNNDASYNGNSATSLYRSYIYYYCYSNTGSSVTSSYTYRPGISPTSSSIYTGGAQTKKIEPVLPEITETLQPTRTGYTWKGFGTTSSGGTQIVDENGNWKLNRDSSDLYPRTAYAMWTANKYTVTANANSGTIPSTTGWTGTGSTATKSVTFNSTYGTLPTPTRTGYTFSGWYTSATGGTKITSSSTVNRASSHTLYAQWTAKNYTLTIYPHSGSTYKNLVPASGIANDWTTTGNNMTLTYTASQGVYTLTPANTSDPYSNLNYAVNLPVGTYVMNAVVTDASDNRLTGSPLQVFYGISYGYSEAQSVRFGDTTRVTFSITTAGNYNFRFDNDYGGNVMKVKQFWISSSTKTTSSFSYSLPYQAYYQLATDEPTRTGYTFKGWSNTSYLSVNSDGVAQNTSTSTQTRQATWEETSYSFTINANGGQVDKNWLYGPSFKNGFDETYHTLRTLYNDGVLEFCSTCDYEFFDLCVEEAGSFYFKIPQGVIPRGDEGFFFKYYVSANEDGQPQYETIYVGLYGYSENEDSTTVNEIGLETYEQYPFDEPGEFSFAFEDTEGKLYDYYYIVAYSNNPSAQESMYLKYPQVYDSFSSLMESYTISLGYQYGYTLPIPTRTGYTFTGWSFSSSLYDVVQADFDSNLYTILMGTSDVVATAQWSANNYSVNWNGNNATLNSNLWNYAGSTGYRSSNTGSNSSYTFSSKTAISSVTYDSALSYSAPIPLKIGYTFNGWWSAASGGVQVADTNGKLIANVSGWTNSSSQWAHASASTLYAQWTKNSYTITYNLNGGTASSTAPTSYTFGSSKAVGNPTRTGYTFAGWTVTATLTGKTYATINLTNGTMQYDSSYPNAVYFPLFYQAANVAYSGKVSDQNSEIRWRQYTTAGAYHGSNSGTSSTACYTSLWYHGGMNSTTTTISWTQGTGYTIPATQVGDLALIARWTVNNYTLTANANGGSIPSTTGWSGTGATATKSVAYNTAYGTLPTPTKTGYGFAGWWTAASGGTQVSASTKMGASNATIYAHWTINSYTLTANCNGGSAPSTLPTGWTANGTSPYRSLNYNTAYGTLPEPTRQGYIFAGWWTQASGGSEVNRSTKIGTASVTIYAHWVESWVKYMSNGNPVMDQADGYYIIDSAEKLARLAYLVNYNIDGGKWAEYQYKQTADIDLSAHYWQPIGTESYPFSGTFDGTTFDIHNMKTYCGTKTKTYYNLIGMFGYISAATIKNVNNYDVNIAGRQSIGAIAGCDDSSTIQNCKVSGAVTGEANDIGGVIGYSTQSNVIECENGASVKCNNYNGQVGGIVGEGYKTTITNCVNTGAISAYDKVGGIVGFADGTEVKGCVNSGELTSAYDAGGIIGFGTSFNVYNCVNTGRVEGCKRIGGAAGYSEGTVIIENFVNTGKLVNVGTGEESESGGIMGYVEGTMTISSSFVDCSIVSGSKGRVGAFMGEDYDGAIIKYCGARINIETAISNLSPFVNTSGICNDSYALINNGGTQVNRITATNSGMDGKFGMISSIHDGLPIPLGIYHISQYGTTTGIASTLTGSKYGCTTA